MVEPSPPDSRRGFLKFLTAAIGASTGAIAVIPGLRMLAHPLRKETVTGAGEPVRVASVSDVKPGKPLRVNVIGQVHDAWLRLDSVKLGTYWLVRGASN